MIARPSGSAAPIAVVLGLLATLALYGGAYAGVRLSGVLASVQACDSIWPCPVAILGAPVWRTVFAPAIAVETQVRYHLDELRGP